MKPEKHENEGEFLGRVLFLFSFLPVFLLENSSLLESGPLFPNAV
jgi:hypothetical protein